MGIDVRAGVVDNVVGSDLILSEFQVELLPKLFWLIGWAIIVHNSLYKLIRKFNKVLNLNATQSRSQRNQIYPN